MGLSKGWEVNPSNKVTDSSSIFLRANEPRYIHPVKPHNLPMREELCHPHFTDGEAEIWSSFGRVKDERGQSWNLNLGSLVPASPSGCLPLPARPGKDET